MKGRKILGLAIGIIGIALIFVAVYINNQVASGEEQISSAKQKVNSIDNLFSVTPESKQIGSTLTTPAKRKIKEGEAEVTYYSQLAKNIQIGAIILIVLGSGLFFFPSRKRG